MGKLRLRKYKVRYESHPADMWQILSLYDSKTELCSLYYPGLTQKEKKKKKGWGTEGKNPHSITQRGRETMENLENLPGEYDMWHSIN